MSMNTKMQIVNQALVQLAQEPIGSFEYNIFGTIASTFWNGSVDTVLRGHPWNFAARRQVLARLEAAPAYGFSSAFQMPADCVRVLEVGAREYKIEGRQILCSEAALALRYISNAVNITEWDALFCDALSMYLAWKMAYPITKSGERMEACWQAYVQILKQARSVDAQEEPADDFGESELIRVRG